MACSWALLPEQHLPFTPFTVSDGQRGYDYALPEIAASIIKGVKPCMNPVRSLYEMQVPKSTVWLRSAF
jgi:hypothetical protein